VKLTTHLHLVPRSKNARSCTSIPPTRLHGLVLSLKKDTGTTLPLPLPLTDVVTVRNFNVMPFECIFDSLLVEIADINGSLSF
jgi:hypothetical protein